MPIIQVVAKAPGAPGGPHGWWRQALTLPWLLDICPRLLRRLLVRYCPRLLPRLLGKRSPRLVGLRPVGRQPAVLCAHIAGKKMSWGTGPAKCRGRIVHLLQSALQSSLQTSPGLFTSMDGPSDTRREEPAHRTDAPIWCAASPLDHPGQSICCRFCAGTPSKHHLSHSIIVMLAKILCSGAASHLHPNDASAAPTPSKPMHTPTYTQV